MTWNSGGGRFDGNMGWIWRVHGRRLSRCSRRAARELGVIRRERRSRLSGIRFGRQDEDATVKASVFIGTSVDGFIARANGALDFLPPGGGEPHGYDEFMATVDALVIGRKTFETVLTFDA